MNAHSKSLTKYLLVFGAMLSSATNASYETLAISGAASPELDGTFATFDVPRLTALGQVGFTATLTGTPNGSGVFFWVPDAEGFSAFDVFAPRMLVEGPRRGDPSPDGDGNLNTLSSLAIADQPNFNGTMPIGINFVALTTFSGTLNTSGLLTGNAGAYGVALHSGYLDARGLETTSPGVSAVVSTNSGFVSTVYRATATDSVVFYDALSSNSGPIAYEGDVVVADNPVSGVQTSLTVGALFGFAVEAVNGGSGSQVAFRADIVSPNPDSGETQGILLRNESGIFSLLDSNAGNAGLNIFNPVLGSGGLVAYRGVDTIPTASQSIRVAAQFAQPTVLAATGNMSYDGNGLFATFSDPSISAANGYIAFLANLTNTAAGALDNQGIYRTDASGLGQTSIVRENQLMPGTTARFEQLETPVVNSQGVTLFGAKLGNGAGGPLDGLFLGNGSEFLTVAKQGEAMGGSLIVNVDYSFSDPGGRRALNDFGQVAFRASLADGRQVVQLFTPGLEFKGTGEALWIDPANWTLGILPGAPHTAYIRPSSGQLTVQVPVWLPPEAGYFENAFRKLVLEPSNGAQVTLNMSATAGVPGLPPSGGTVGILGEELVIGSGATMNVGSLPGETAVNLQYKTLTMQGGVLQLAAGATDGRTTMSASEVRGFGTVNALFCCQFFGIVPSITAEGGLLDLTYLYVPDTDIRVTAGATLNMRISTASIFDDYSSTVTLEGGVMNVFDEMHPGAGARITGHGQLNTRYRGLDGSTIDASGGLLRIGNAGAFGGFSTEGDIAVRSGATLDLRTRISAATIGRETVLENGTLMSQSGIYLGGGKLLRGSGHVSAGVQAAIGSTIFAEGALTLGDASALNGFFSDGQLYVEHHTVTINDRNEAVLGALTTIGSSIGDGTLIAANGLLVEFGKALSGHGDVFADVLNNGFIEGAGPAPDAALELHGLVKGVGGYGGTIIFSGEFSPGLSPAEVEMENAVMRGDTTIELGGLIQGDEYDHIKARGRAILGGRLSIDLIDGFTPSAGDSFTVVSAAEGIFGEFDALIFPTLVGQRWTLVYGAHELQLVASAVPLPAGGWLMLSALGGLLMSRVRRR